ncbi:hypothetical protein BDU57DRAFT_546159 [Ampelomyces quisqualis]|uniref:DNA-directed RNA polymerase n=1 Tax=Ampelomyces quisqualis TaxID=50730 RepID=A0A6A5QVJ9_AMPQU|nr:hypothetical protein BDU57DRAFT_546159 [Ampelomyces quisqualis]
MLARAARRKLHNDALVAHAQTGGRLTLPWLCPALSRPSTHNGALAAYVATPSSALSRHSKRPASLPRSTRSLATTAEWQPPPASSPFHGFMQAWGSRTPPPELARYPPLDASNPLVLRDALATPGMIRTTKGKKCIRGDAVDLLENLYASLRVGRTDRASVILAKLADVYEATAPELVEAHNIFLQTLFDLEQQDSKPNSMRIIRDWYENNSCRRHVPPNAQTFVTLLRAAMNFLDGNSQDEALKTYLQLARQHDVLDDVNYSAEFTDEEWDMLIRAQPEEFEEPPSVQEVQDLLVNAPAARRSMVDYGLATAPHVYIRAVPQKGLGLDSLKRALQTFTDNVAVEQVDNAQGTPEEQEFASRYARQLHLEKDALVTSVQRWQAQHKKLHDLGIYGVMNAKPIQALMHQWYHALVPLWKKELARVKKTLNHESTETATDPAYLYGPWLEQCTPETLAAITVSRAVSALVADKRDTTHKHIFKISAVTVGIGREVQEVINSTTRLRHENFLKKQRKELRQELGVRLNRTTDDLKNDKVTAPASACNVKYQKIPVDARTSIGALAIELLLSSATITATAQDPKTGKQLTSTQPAFQHTMAFDRGRKTGFLTPHPHFVAKLDQDPLNIEGVRLPMIVEPKPWVGFEDGGYYTVPQRVVRQKGGDTSQRAYAESAIENGDMRQVLAGLDVLGRVPWQINLPVLTVMAEVWNKGEGVGGLIPEHPVLQRPMDLSPDASHSERVKWAKKMQQYENDKAALHSQRCFQNFVLETARAYSREKAMYFPHSIDFRGRAYPIPPVLNHIGADVSRGLLKFAHGKELGTVGLQWLKIHLANLYGFDKASLVEREQFAMNHIDEIYDSATNPLDGRRWWTKGEDPWQTLACCMELKNALDSSDPTRYVSQLPVHQDGTCNGLQHYAALGGDEAGARQVNLEPSDRPQDIYTGVAELVKGMVSKDAQGGNPVAKFIDGHISRKVVKRTVMTNVYGVTFIGAKAQVESELRVMFPNFVETKEVKHLGMVALYVAYKIFDALGQIFNGAQEIQYWLGECAHRIVTSISAEQAEMIYLRGEGVIQKYDPIYKTPGKLLKTDFTRLQKSIESFRTSIIWTTPLKMPVVQPYRKDSTMKVQTRLQDITVPKRSATDEVDKRKQLQGFPPNFIHSLDATHMTLSALKCSELGIDFAAVHDSFWTHASDIPNLNIVLRDAFVRMHSEDIIGRLAEEFKTRYAGAMYLGDISSSSVAGTKIREWRISHARSLGRTVFNGETRRGFAPYEEIVLEVKRQKLLASQDPAEVKKGQEMVTPCSIWLDHQDPNALMTTRRAALGDTAIQKVKASEGVKRRLAEAVQLDKETVEAVTDSTPLSEGMDSEADRNLEETGTVEDVDKPSKRGRRHQPVAAGFITVWIPLSFPPPPKKGTWDVSRLRESKSLPLSAKFNPVKEAYWTGLPHHRRTPFALSPDGKSAYLAYLDASDTNVHIQQVDPSSFAAVGDTVTVSGAKEAGGLVAHDDGFALLTNEAMPSGTSNAPPDGTPVAVLYRYTSGKQTWKTWLGGPDNAGGMGALASPDLNGDLVYSEKSGLYGAYFVVTAYSGSGKGHFGDAIQYVAQDGTLEQIPGASSSWGCSHNTGIAFEAADSAPFASLCSEDQGAIWLNTGDTGMSKSGVKVSNENVQNGAGNEAMGGTSGSYSGLARFIGSDSYIFSWVSRGAKDLTTNEWMGNGYTKSENRTVNRNVAIATFSDKKTIVGEQATSVLGPDGDKQVNWITTGSADCQNAHVAAFDNRSALVTWEEIANPTCEFIAMGCKGAFTGSYFQLVTEGKKVGTALKSLDVFVAGDMVTMADGRVCWPYIDMEWTLDGPVRNAVSTNAVSFACMSLDSSGSGMPSSPAATVSADVVISARPVSSTSPPSVFSAERQPSFVAKNAEGYGGPIEIASSLLATSITTDRVPAASSLPSFVLVSSVTGIDSSTSSNAPVVTPHPTPFDDDQPAPYNSSIQLPASELFNPSQAPVFATSAGIPLVSYTSAPSSTSCANPVNVTDVASERTTVTSTPTPSLQVPANKEIVPSSSLSPTDSPSAEGPCTESTAAVPSAASGAYPSGNGWPINNAAFPTGSGPRRPTGTVGTGRSGHAGSGRLGSHPRPARVYGRAQRARVVL